MVRNVHFKQAARKHRPVNQHYFIFQILTEKKSLPPLGLQTSGALGVPKNIRDDMLFGGEEEAEKYDKETKEMIDAATDVAKDATLTPIKPAGLGLKALKKALNWLWKKFDPGEEFPDDPQPATGGE